MGSVEKAAQGCGWLRGRGDSLPVWSGSGDFLGGNSAEAVAGQLAPEPGGQALIGDGKTHVADFSFWGDTQTTTYHLLNRYIRVMPAHQQTSGHSTGTGVEVHEFQMHMSGVNGTASSPGGRPLPPPAPSPGERTDR